jgi:muramidase (phage lysozyme)
MARLPGISKNLSAFLDTIAVSEGTFGKGDDGYDILCGGERFHSYKHHPNIKVHIPKLGIDSTAAGRYQILFRYAQAYSQQLGLTDFSPESQDQIAIQMIKECGALDEIVRGDIAKAIRLCRSRWASFPGAGYGQHENKLNKLIEAFNDAVHDYA